MHAILTVIVLLLILVAAGLAAMAWLALAQVADEMRALESFEGMHFDV